MQERIQLMMLVSLAHYVSTLSLSAARQIVGVDTVIEKNWTFVSRHVCGFLSLIALAVNNKTFAEHCKFALILNRDRSLLFR